MESHVLKMTSNECNETTLKQLNGFSGSSVYLIQDSDKIFVRKIGNVDRNYERMQVLLRLGYNLPKIYNKHRDILDIEYIAGLDIKTYLRFNQPTAIIDFLISTLRKLSADSYDKDYSEIYIKKLNDVDFSLLPFTKLELFDKLPKILPQSIYYGDLTLENIIYSRNREFYLIDPATIEYDSWVFDIAKLRQDLQCKWFLKHDNLFLDTKLNLIQNEIFNKFPESNNDCLLILMLLRVFNHTERGSFEQEFLLREINKLWK